MQPRKDRGRLGLSPVPDKIYGDVKAYCRLAHIALSVWSDLIRLKSSVHEDYHKCLQMGGKERMEMMDLVLKTDAILTYAFSDPVPNPEYNNPEDKPIAFLTSEGTFTHDSGKGQQ